MKRPFTIIVTVLVGTVLFAGLVYAALLAAHVSEPATTTVYGPTARRLWATMMAALALIGVIIGGLSLRLSARRSGTGEWRKSTILALVAGLIAMVNGGINLATAEGGPGSGNGVVGGAIASVLGLIAMTLAGRALVLSRRASGPGADGTA
jgi:hypothetical protein